MAQRFLTSINLSSNELQNALLHPLATPPSVGTAGKVYYNTTENILYVSDGSSWRSVSGDITSIIAGTGIDVSGVTGDVTVSLADTTVTTGSYGSATQIPTFTVDQQGRLTAAGQVSVATDLSISDGTTTDTVSLLTDTLTFTATANETTVAVTDNTITIGLPDDVTIANDLTVSGNLTVSGSVTTVNTETINLADNVILINSNATGTPTEDGGVEVERGDNPNVSLIWDESSDRWSFTNDGTTFYTIPVPSEIDASVTDREFATSIGDGTTTTYTVTHNLNSKDVIVQLYDNSTFDTVYADVVRDTVNSVQVSFSTAPTLNDIRVLITKIG